MAASNTKIDASQVKWDPIDPAKVQWDEPRLEASPVAQGAKDFVAGAAQGAKDLGAGLVRGAGSIGATLMSPVDLLTGNKTRRRDMDSALAELVGANPDSFNYGAGKLTGEVGGSAGAGPAIAKVVGGAAPVLASSIASGGFIAPNMATRVAGGGVSGAASAGLVDPEHAAAGGGIGAALPPAIKLAAAAGSKVGGAVRDSAEKLMQSAIKPTIAQLRDGSAATAVRVLLDYGISPTKRGVEKLQELISGKNDAIADMIANSGATVDKQAVLGTLGNVRQKFSNQVSPTGDLNAIQRVADDFTAHPNLVGNDIPVQSAQKLKQGTYKVLSGKYGEVGSAETEAQKALARGLKDEIATAVPGVGALNAEESRLITALNVAERRALMELNKNPMGLAALASSPVSWAAFMADRSSAFKALAARVANRVGQSQGTNAMLNSPGLQELLGRTAPVLASD